MRALVAVFVFGSLGCAAEERAEPHAPPPPSPEVHIVARTPHIATYPCAEQCHAELTPNPTPRGLTAFHAGRRVEHGPGIGWCDTCHALEGEGAIDSLVLNDGRRVSFDESDQVCAQCHGEKHRDWELGIHGLSTGGWTGTVERRSCTACHDPHAPGRIEFEALPPPVPDPRSPQGSSHEQG